MGIGIIVIGSELLSGKRRDGHLEFVITTLAPRGMELDWATYLGDDPHRLRAELCRAMSGNDIVFSFGGIGATPDDHTRQCAADAAGIELLKHAQAAAIIEQRFGDYRETELGVRALPQAAQLAHLWLREALNEAGFAFKEGGR